MSELEKPLQRGTVPGPAPMTPNLHVNLKTYFAAAQKATNETTATQIVKDRWASWACATQERYKRKGFCKPRVRLDKIRLPLAANKRTALTWLLLEGR